MIVNESNEYLKKVLNLKKQTLILNIEEVLNIYNIQYFE